MFEDIEDLENEYGIKIEIKKHKSGRGNNGHD